MPVLTSGSSTTVTLGDYDSITLQNRPGQQASITVAGTLVNGAHTGSRTYGPYNSGTSVSITATVGDLYYEVADGVAPSTPGTGSGSVAVQYLSADRALAAGDLAANLVLTANRAVSLASGLGAGFNTQFSNGGSSSVTITVTPGAGVTLNGASSAVTRTLAAGQTTALLPVGTNAYILPGA